MSRSFSVLGSAALLAGAALVPGGSWEALTRSSVWVGASVASAGSRLGAWYDRSEGLGIPCPTADLRVYDGPGGVVLEVPACWEKETARSGGVIVHRLRDPAPGLGEVALVAIPASDSSRFERYRSEIEQKLERPGASESRVEPWRRVALRYTGSDPRSPWRYFEWHLLDGDGAVSVSYRVQKVLAHSPKILSTLAAVEQLTLSIRRSPDGTGLAKGD